MRCIIVAILMALMGAATLLQAQTPEIYTFTTNRVVPDGNPAGLIDVRSVDSTIAAISSVKVRLKITGEFNGDLYGYVTHSTGLTVLLNRPGKVATNACGYSDRGLDVTFESGATNGDIHVYRTVTTPAAGQPLTGIWQPDGRTTDPTNVTELSVRDTSLTNFIGLGAGGEWTLYLADVESGGTNMLSEWGLEITGQEAPLLTWASPADIVFGAALGASQLNATATFESAPVPGTFTYDPPAGTVLNAGAGQMLSVTFTPADTNAFLAASTNVFINVLKAPATVTLADLTQTYSGTARIVTATTTPLGLPVIVTYDGSLNAPTNAASYAVIGTVNHTNFQGSATGTLVVNKANATVTLAGLTQTYDGSPRIVSITTTPGGLAVNVTYNGSAMPPIDPGSYTVVGTINEINYQGSSTNTLVVNKATATVTLAGLTQTYDGTARIVTATTAPSGLMVNVTYNGSLNAPTNAGNYTVIGTVNEINYQGSATNTLVVNKAAATVSLADLLQTYDGTARIVTFTTTPASLAVNVTYNGSATAPTDAGNYTVIGTISEINYQGSATNTLVVNKSAATVTLADLTQTYSNGAARNVTATTTPVGLPVIVTYNGITNAPTDAGSYAVVGTINHINFQGSATNTLVVNKAAAAVNVANVLTQTYNGNARIVTFTTTPASLPVIVTYNGSTTAPINAGSYTVIGTVNHTNYQGSATNTLVVNKANATVNLANLTQTYNGAARIVTATTVPAGLMVDVTYNGSASAPTNAGSYTVVGTIDDSNRQGSTTNTLVVNKFPATVTLAGLTQTYDGTGRIVTATTAPSGLMVDVTYNGSSIAPTNAGSYTVIGTIDEPNHRGSATNTLVVNKAPATVRLADLLQTYDGTARVVNATTTPSGLLVTVTYNGSVAAPTNAGSYTVIGTINEANHQGSATNTLVVSKAAGTVTLANLTQTFNGSARIATATTEPSGLLVNITYNGSITAPTNADSYTVIGTINETNYQGSATNTLVVNKAAATVTLDNLTRTYNGSPRTVTATTIPGGLTVNVTYDGSSTAPVNAGSYVVVGTINNINYQGSATNTLVVNKAAATVNLANLTQTYNGNARIATFTTSPAGLDVDVTYNGSAIAPTNAGSYTVIGTVNEINHQGSATNTLVVNKAAATVTLADLIQTYDGTARIVTFTTSPASLAVNVTYNGSATAPTNAGSYTVIGTVNEINHQGSATNTLVVNKAAATVTLAGLTQTYAGTARIVSASTAPAGLTVNVTYDGSSIAPVNAGSYNVVGTIDEINYQGSASGTLVVSKAGATVTLGNLTQTYDGSPRIVSATTVPIALIVDVTYSGSSIAPVDVGSYVVVGTINDINYEGSATDTLVVNKANATVTLAGLTQTYDGTARMVTFTTTPASLAVNVTYDGSPTAPTNAGSYVVAGTINELNYEGSATDTLVVEKAATASLQASSANPALPGTTVMFTMSVSSVLPGGGTPDGTVTFRIDGAAAGSAALVEGTAEFATNGLPVGAHTVVSEYAGGPNFLGTTNTLAPSLIVNTPPVASDDTIERYAGRGIKVPLATLLANDADADLHGLSATVSPTSANGGTVVLLEGWVCYVPPAGFTNVDSFTYTITDDLGGMDTATVTVGIRVDDDPGVNLTITPVDVGSVRIRGCGIIGRTYRLQYTEGLSPANWQELSTVTANSVGRFEYIDTGDVATRFYRTVYP